MIKYPDGKKFNSNLNKNKIQSKKSNSFSHGNRGMNLENDINITNEYYKNHNLCLVTKRPTPINVVSVDYSKGAIITNAYFEKQSTTDYNGVYKGKYIDFEAKSTRKTTSFPLSNITFHQIQHLKSVIYHNGIAFFIVEFAKLNKVFLIDAKYIISCYESEKRRSIQYSKFLEYGYLIKRQYLPRLDYLEIVQKIYFE